MQGEGEGQRPPLQLASGPAPERNHRNHATSTAGLLLLACRGRAPASRPDQNLHRHRTWNGTDRSTWTGPCHTGMQTGHPFPLSGRNTCAILQKAKKPSQLLTRGELHCHHDASSSAASPLLSSISQSPAAATRGLHLSVSLAPRAAVVHGGYNGWLAIIKVLARRH